MTQYLIKSTLVLLTLIILWCIAKRQEELGSEIVDTKEKVDLLRGELFQSEISFKQKKLAEEKRIMNYADDTVHGPNHRFTTADMPQKKKNHVYYMRSKAKKAVK